MSTTQITFPNGVRVTIVQTPTVAWAALDGFVNMPMELENAEWILTDARERGYSVESLTESDERE